MMKLFSFREKVEPNIDAFFQLIISKNPKNKLLFVGKSKRVIKATLEYLLTNKTQKELAEKYGCCELAIRETYRKIAEKLNLPLFDNWFSMTTEERLKWFEDTHR
jgi:hypothetical protein